MSDVPIACDMQAIAADQRVAHQQVAEHLFAAVQEVRELPDGYALRLPEDSVTFTNAVSFLVNERLCCPFFHFTLDLTPEQGPIWLHITGGAGVKAFVAAEVLSHIPASVTWIH
jgi:hypothetical protein